MQKSTNRISNIVPSWRPYQYQPNIQHATGQPSNTVQTSSSYTVRSALSHIPRFLIQISAGYPQWSCLIFLLSPCTQHCHSTLSCNTSPSSHTISYPLIFLLSFNSTEWTTEHILKWTDNLRRTTELALHGARFESKMGNLQYCGDLHQPYNNITTIKQQQ